jgi:DNA repair protein RecO (recombination protein O)
VPTYRDEGVVLRTFDLGEADRIVTILTRSHGKVRAVAKGVRRTASKFGSRLEPFMVTDVQFYHGRSSLDTIQQAETLGSYGADIAGHYDRFTAANVMAETAERLTDTEPAVNQYTLLIGGLRSLSRGEHSPSLTLDSYLMRAFSIAGWSPSLDSCGRCGSEFHLNAFVAHFGGLVCDGCAPSGSPRVTSSVVGAFNALLEGNWVALEQTDSRDLERTSGLISAFTQWHLERGLKSMEHVAR